MMKSKLLLLCLISAILLLFSSFDHPIKLSASLVEYDTDSAILRMECKVFVDDFENCINKRLTKNIDFNELTHEDRLIIEDYFKTNYNIKVNTKKLDLSLIGTELQEAYNILIVRFMTNKINLKKEDNIKIENTLFFDEFGDLQSNRVTLRMPPFFKEKNFISSAYNYAFNHTL